VRWFRQAVRWFRQAVRWFRQAQPAAPFPELVEGKFGKLNFRAVSELAEEQPAASFPKLAEVNSTSGQKSAKVRPE